MATDDSHECPGPGCTIRVGFSKLACRRHWNMVSPATQGRLYRAYRDEFGERGYFEVRAQCLREMGVPADAVAVANGGIS